MKLAPPSQEVILAAAGWMARLWSERASEQDRQACAAWLAEHPDHQLAWHYLQRFESTFSSLPAHATSSLLAPHRTSRRKVMALGGLMLGGGLLYQAGGNSLWRQSLADLQTRTGEIRQATLPDGSRIVLNTDTRLDLAFDGQRRHLQLYRGEILVDTAPHDTPFQVQTRHGQMTPMGTRFSVRLADEHTQVAVYQGAVRVEPAKAAPLLLSAGQASHFSSTTVAAPGKAREQDLAWRNGRLVAEAMPLPRFIAELSRYRTGLLHCDAALGALHVSGVYPLDDTDRTLANLAQALPVKVHYLTRYWVRVSAS